MKEKLEEIQDIISKSGEIVNDNINNDYGFTYGEISEIMRKAENEVLASNNKSQAKIIASKKVIHKFYEKVLSNIEHEIDKKNIVFGVKDCNKLNEYLYWAYNQLGETIK